MSANFDDESRIYDAVAVPARMKVLGKFVIAESNTIFPLRCVKTNQPISAKDLKRWTLFWCPPQFGYVLLFSPVLCCTVCIHPVLVIPSALAVVFIMYFVMRVPCRIVFGLHPTRLRKYRLELAGTILGSVVAACLMPLAIYSESVVLDLMDIIFFVGSLIAIFLVRISIMRVTYQSDGCYWIKGCSPEFLESLSKEA